MTSRAAIASLALLASFGPKMPEGCAKMLQKPAKPEPTAPASAPVTAPVTVTSAAAPPGPTTPPIWQPPPDNRPAPLTPDKAELAKLRAASEKKEWKTVRSLVDKKAKEGKASEEEVDHLFDACTALKDKECLAMLFHGYDKGTDPDPDPGDAPAPASSTKKPKPKK